MKKFSLAATIGGALLCIAPAYATTSTFVFTGGNGADNLSSYSVTNGQTGANLITATASAFYATATKLTGTGSNSPIDTVPTSNLSAGYVGAYSGAGIAICEGTTSPDCASPNHQIDNATNTSSNPGTSLTGSTVDFEFMLIQFSSAVDLGTITLGNYGTTGSSANPFLATYFTSSSILTAPNMATALEATTLGSLSGTGFAGSEAQTTCTTGCTLNATGVNESLSGNDITYLLIGASIVPGQAGQDFFKIQDLTNITPFQGQVSGTPEPATFGLVGLALTGLGIAMRKRRANKK